MGVFKHKKSDTERVNTNEYEFMSEVIKDRPVNYKKILQKTLLTIGLAIVFGLVSSFVFIGLEPLANKLLKKETPVSREEVTLKVEVPQIDVEDEFEPDLPYQQEVGLKVDSVLEDSPDASVGDEVDAQIVVYENASFGIEEYKNLYAELSTLVEQVSPCLVQVVGTKSEENWFKTAYSSDYTSTGIILNTVAVGEEQEEEYLILVNQAAIREAEIIDITFCDGHSVPATFVAADVCTGFAIVAVSSQDMEESTREIVQTVSFSTDTGKLGDPVLAVGTIMNSQNSMSFGMLTDLDTKVYCPDITMNLLQTNIYSGKNPSGILVNMDGKIIGIIQNAYNSEDMKNILSAVSINEVRNRINMLMNQKAIPYTGAYIADVPKDVRHELSIPSGAYVYQLTSGSPAMKAGLQVGDIISAIDEDTLYSATGYITTIQNSTVGEYHIFTIYRSTSTGYRNMKLAVLVSTTDKIK